MIQIHFIIIIFIEMMLLEIICFIDSLAVRVLFHLAPFGKPLILSSFSVSSICLALA